MAATYNIESIFKKYKDRVYRLAISIVHNDKDAEDVMQNTFLKVMDNLKYFRSDSSISTWIYRIAYNEALMYLRKRRKATRLSDYLEFHAERAPLSMFINWSKLPDEQLLEDEFKKRMDTAIKQMPIKYRMALLLNNVENLPLKDSASILGLRVNSLKTRLHRARLIIREEISDYFKDREEKEQKQDKKCNILTSFAYKYSAGFLNRNKEVAFKHHIEDCLSCKSFFHHYQKAISITDYLQCQDLPEELQRKIETFIFKRRSKKPIHTAKPQNVRKIAKSFSSL